MSTATPSMPPTNAPPSPGAATILTAYRTLAARRGRPPTTDELARAYTYSRVWVRAGLDELIAMGILPPDAGRLPDREKHARDNEVKTARRRAAKAAKAAKAEKASSVTVAASVAESPPPGRPPAPKRTKSRLGPPDANARERKRDRERRAERRNAELAERRERVRLVAERLIGEGLAPTSTRVSTEMPGVTHQMAANDLGWLRKAGVLPPAAACPRDAPKPITVDPSRRRRRRTKPSVAPGYEARTSSPKLRRRWTEEDAAVRASYHARLTPGARWLLVDSPMMPAPSSSPRGVPGRINRAPSGLGKLAERAWRERYVRGEIGIAGEDDE